MKNNHFVIEEKNNCIISICHPDDAYRMNWAEGRSAWGTMLYPEGIEGLVQRSFTPDGNLREQYTFVNTTDFDIMIGESDLGVYATFPDDYLDGTYMTQKCHAHIWCGGSSSYICGLRMGGEAPHLGLILQEGKISNYSVDGCSGNKRGDFILHPDPVHLAPGESYSLAWDVFWHEGTEDFHKKLQGNPQYFPIHATNFLLFEGESIDVDAEISKPEQPLVQINGAPVEYSMDGRTLGISLDNCAVGEYNLSVHNGGLSAHASFLVQPALKSLAASRCQFIAGQQQCKRKSHLEGAYLSYDNESGSLVYSHKVHDHNGGRERVGMGVLMAAYLQQVKDNALLSSLNRYRSYVLRELFDADTGVVYNDICRNNDWDRLYNYPWMATFFLELYHLNSNRDDLIYAFRALVAYYQKGGCSFYAIDIPIVELYQALRTAGLFAEADELLSWVRNHADRIQELGTAYPPSEVNYEQAIVAPAVSCLLQVYILTNEVGYLASAEEQLKVLNLFNGRQPDYHLHQVAVRYWDGYWFGKRKLFGDTFPHYWSSLTGRVYELYANITGDESYRKMAEQSIRGSLSLFMPDGSASCASIYPLTVNGERGQYMEPWANDQDWALYYALKYFVGSE